MGELGRDNPTGASEHHGAFGRRLVAAGAQDASFEGPEEAVGIGDRLGWSTFM